jgi:hypothetical protein
MDPNNVSSLVYSYPWNIVIVAVPLAAGLIGALVGSWIAGRATAKSLSAAKEMELQKQEQGQKLALQNFYKSLLVEMETLWHIYQETTGSKLESLKQQDPVTWYCPITEQHFQVYRANSSLIGCISDNNLRSLLVKAHSEIQTLFAAYGVNNHLLMEWEQWDRAEKESAETASAARARSAYAALVGYANAIRKAHYAVRADMSRLMGSLQQNIEPEV